MSARRLRVIFSPRARQDLREILAYTRRQWGDGQRAAYAAAISATLDRLAEFPGLGRSADEYRAGARRFPVREHVIYYEADDRRLRVARILHGRMDAVEAFKDEPSA